VKPMGAESSLFEMISAASATAKPVSIINSHGTETSNWTELHDDARRMAAILQARGLSPEDRVAVIGETSRELVTAVQAIWLAGASLTVLPLRGRLRNDSVFATQTREKLQRLRPSLVCGDPSWLSVAGIEGSDGGLGVMELAHLSRLAAQHAEAFERPTDEPDRPALLQFTSGSTSEPKAVMVPERCLVSNIKAMERGFELAESDSIMSWLPLFHDMGLIGMLTLAMATGTEMVLAAPAVFAAEPRRWMEWISDFRTSISCAPNFAYGVAARSLASSGSHDLSCWRVAANGAEPIDVPTLRRFIAAAGLHGFPPSSAFCVYGLAEATLAVTFPIPGAGLEVDIVDRSDLEKLRYARPSTESSPDGRRFAFLGRALGDFKLQVRRASGHLAADREIGELEIRGSSVTPGYLGGPKLAPDGWLRTGDLAYMVDGQLVISGRLKDMIIIAGRNICPEDVERAAELVDGVRTGNVVAFGVQVDGGREAVVVAAECRPAAAHAAIRRGVAEAALDTVGISPHDVVLLEPGTLPKTSSGKLQRARCKQSYLDGTLTIC
jgi:fatty-acyl-CoA synthase